MVALKIAADHGFETQTLAQLDHPNIVRVYDQRPLLEQRLQLIYMQYLPGGTLDDVVKSVRQTPAAERSGKMLLACIDRRLHERADSPPGDSRARQFLAGRSWPETVCWLGARIAAALDHAHTHGVLHRDLKPANVLLAADMRILGWQISTSALVPSCREPAAAYFGGSLAYMSPEQLDICLGTDRSTAESLDERSDLFTLGVLLWELLTGERPFGDERKNRTDADGARDDWRRDAMKNWTKTPCARLPADCPAGLIEVLRGLLQPDRERRTSSADSVRRQLDLCLRPEQSSVWPGRSARGWSRRSRHGPGRF